MPTNDQNDKRLTKDKYWCTRRWSSFTRQTFAHFAVPFCWTIQMMCSRWIIRIKIKTGISIRKLSAKMTNTNETFSQPLDDIHSMGVCVFVHTCTFVSVSLFNYDWIEWMTMMVMSLDMASHLRIQWHDSWEGDADDRDNRVKYPLGNWAHCLASVLASIHMLLPAVAWSNKPCSRSSSSSKENER